MTDLTADIVYRDFVIDGVPSSEPHDPPKADIRELLTSLRYRLLANRTYYVRSDGDDDNDGLANTAGGAFLTIQGAINNLRRKVDFGGYAVTLRVGAGTYAGFTIYGKFNGESGKSPLSIIGDESTPGNVIISATNSWCVFGSYDARIKVAGFKLTSTGASGYGVLAARGSNIEIQNIEFGANGQDHILAVGASLIQAMGPITVSGGANSFIHSAWRSHVNFAGVTVTFTGTPTFSNYIIGVNDATLILNGATFTGARNGGTLIHYNATVDIRNMTGNILGESPFTITPDSVVLWDDLTSRTLYVRTDGSSHNDGYANTAARAFATLNQAITFLANLPFDPLRTTINIQVEAGTYNDPVVLKNIPGNPLVTITGSETTPANVVINHSGNTISADGLSTVWELRGLKVTSSGGACIEAANGSRVRFRTLDFGSASGSHISVQSGSLVVTTGNYAITGAAVRHISLRQGRMQFGAGTITITGSLDFSGEFAWADLGSTVFCNSALVTIDISGATVTGQRYDIRSNAAIDTNGGGASYFPGDSVGSTASGGQYV